MDILKSKVIDVKMAEIDRAIETKLKSLCPDLPKFQNIRQGNGK